MKHKNDTKNGKNNLRSAFIYGWYGARDSFSILLNLYRVPFCSTLNHVGNVITLATWFNIDGG